MIKIDVKITYLSGEMKNKEKELKIIIRSDRKSVRDGLNTFMRFILKSCDLTETAEAEIVEERK